MRRNILLSLALWGAMLTAEASVVKLQVEYQTNPIGIDAKAPRFSWQMTSEKRGTRQKAYEIKVFENADFTRLKWTSGRVESDESLHIRYGGDALQPSKRYYWRVTTWNNRGEEETSQELAFFETGLLDSGWSGAEWIQATDIPKDSSEQPAGINTSKLWMTLESDVAIVKGNASVLFGVQDASNMGMWSVITLNKESAPLIRRHVYVGGQLRTSDTPIGKYFTKEQLLKKPFRLKVDAKDGKVETYINNVLVDTYEDSFGELKNGSVGFRAFNGPSGEETAVFDNVLFTQYSKEGNSTVKKVLLKEDFEGKVSPFEGGEVVSIGNNHKLKVFSKGGDYRVFQPIDKGCPMFRKEFKLDGRVASAHIYASALGIYNLFINGQRVGTPQKDGSMVYDELKPGWTNYRKTVHYQSYDVTSLLQKGLNAIGAQVSGGWFTGDVSKGEYRATIPAFIAKLVVNYTDGTVETVVTDLSWLSSTSGAVRLGDIYHGETYDARLESNWTKPGFHDKEWCKTAQNTYPKGELTAFVGPSIRMRPHLNRQPVSIVTYNGETNRSISKTREIKGSQPILLKKGETAVYNMGQNMVGWPHFVVKGERGTTMTLRFGEMLNDTGDPARGDDGPAGSIYTANLRTAKATLRYTLRGDRRSEEFRPSTTFFGFQYCEVKATEDIEILSLEGEVVGSVTEEGSSFATSSPLINQLYSNVLWGQRSNYLSIPTDCPQRDERLGWTGDTQVFCRAATYNANVAAFLEKWMGDMRNDQLGDGAYPGVAPSCWGVPHGQAAWADAGIIVPWTIYLVYNDRGILEDNYTSMEKYMEYLSRQVGDGFNYNGAGTAFGDWLAYEATPNRYISVCYYAYTAQLMEKVSAALSREGGDEYDIKSRQYRKLAADIKEEFQKRYLDEQGDLREKSQTAYLLALKLDLLPSEEATQRALTTLVGKIAANGNRLSTGFVGTAILNQTLSQYGATPVAYNLLLQRDNPSWLYSIDQGATTIWERWDSYTKEKGFNTVTMNSFNHYSYGAVAEWMYRTMAGIDVDEHRPGFKHILLCPEPDNRTVLPEGQEHITWVNASFASPYGDIKSAWTKRDDGSVVYKVSVPANTTASLHLQLPSVDAMVTENGQAAVKSEGVQSIMFTRNKAVLELESGSYEFVVSGK